MSVLGHLKNAARPCLSRTMSLTPALSTTTTTPLLNHLSYRYESTEAAPAKLSSPKLQNLYDGITKLPEEEVQVLGTLILQVLGRKLFPGEFGRGGVVVEAAAEAVEEEVVVKTAFNVKLVGFDAKAKIKVIKEVRAIAGLGLKEAKEMVESAPKVLQKDVSQEKADELKAQLEAIGAQVEIE
eukprot:Nitzschia sp. Nitz4//scaffold148_size54725//38278//38826//NITZ4_006663-RA/size54725-processed-gene-0.87-mRNA-1//-1//CDS//3329536763//4987//frame0